MLTKRTVIVVTVVLLILSAGGAYPYITAASYFDSTTEGWSVTGDVHGFTWSSTVGNPPGSIYGVDDVAGNTWSFVASSQFLGDKSAAYGGTLSWDIQITSRDSAPWSFPDLVLAGGGYTLNWYTTAPVANQWTSYSAPLEASYWVKSTGGAPTETEMKSALSNLTALSIRAEYRTGSDSAYLDNVVMDAPVVPEPSGVLALVTGLAGLAGFAARRRW